MQKLDDIRPASNMEHRMVCGSGHLPAGSDRGNGAPRFYRAGDALAPNLGA